MNKTQYIVVLLCVVLGVSIYVFGKKTVLSQENAEVMMQPTGGMSDDAVLEIAKSRLKPEELEKLTPITLALDTVNNPAQKAALHRAIASFWDTKGDYSASAVHYHRAAELVPEAVSFMLAGTRYQAAAELANDTLLSNFLYKQAIHTMEEATQLNPDDLDMRADLASVIVTATEQPMRGIQQLLDIVKQAPKHLKANMHLARLAVTSGQHDKAVERYNNIIGWYPAFADAYLGLGEAYYSQGQVNDAIRTLEQYKGLVRDEAITAQIDAFITQIRSSIP
jgi:tetratricopeptide (TPR) repeat protein